MPHKQIQKAIKSYLRARRTVLHLGDEHPELIGGNDNIIGRIGEYIAIRFLARRYRQHPRRVDGNANPGFDLIDRGRRRTQVKVITPENQNGRTVRLRQPWDQFVLIVLDENYRPHNIGRITAREHRKARRDNPRWSETPVASVTMLNPRGLIRRYGEVSNNFRL
jgi:hypothetical protein